MTIGDTPDKIRGYFGVAKNILKINSPTATEPIRGTFVEV